MRERHARPCDIESVGLGQPSAEAFFFCTASGRLSWQPAPGLQSLQVATQTWSTFRRRRRAGNSSSTVRLAPH